MVLGNGLQRYGWMAAIGEAVVNFTLSIALGYRFGAVGVARNLIGSIVSVALHFPYTMRYTQLPSRWGRRVRAPRLGAPSFACFHSLLSYLCAGESRIQWILAAITGLVSNGDLDLVCRPGLFRSRNIRRSNPHWRDRARPASERLSSGPTNCKSIRSASVRRPSLPPSIFSKPISSSFPNSSEFFASPIIRACVSRMMISCVF